MDNNIAIIERAQGIKKYDIPTKYTEPLHGTHGGPVIGYSLTPSNNDPFLFEQKYVSQYEYIKDDPDAMRYFSNENVKLISSKITQLTLGVHPEGKRIVIPEDKIRHLMGVWFDSWHGNRRDLNDLVINNAVGTIKDEFETIEQNNKLSAWVTQYTGDLETGALARTAKVKVQKRGPTRFEFNMNY